MFNKSSSGLITAFYSKHKPSILETFESLSRFRTNRVTRNPKLRGNSRSLWGLLHPEVWSQETGGGTKTCLTGCGGGWCSCVQTPERSPAQFP